MTEKPQSIIEPEEAANRLATEVNEAKEYNRRRPEGDNRRRLAAAALLLLATSGIAYLFWPQRSLTPGQVPAVEQTAQFETQGSAFGEMPVPTPSPPQTTIVEADNTELIAQIEDLKRQLDDLKNQPAQVVEPEVAQAPEAETLAQDPRVDELTAQIEELRLLAQETQESMERSLSERDREISMLTAQLDAASLQANGSDPAFDAELEAAARRQAAEEAYQRRLRSPMTVLGGQGGGQSGGTPEGLGAQQARKLSNNEQFVRDVAQPAAAQRAEVIVNPSNTVTQGSMIQAILETAVHSSLPGTIRAIVAEDVHSYDGTRILIPRGSRVVGQYSDDVELGQRRIMVAWSRIILPDNQTVTISAYGGDETGVSGLGGKVNTHFMARFGSAALISLISIAPAIATADTDDETAEDVADAIGQNVTGAVGGSLAGYLDRAPTITVEQGARVTIMVDRDLEIF